MKLNFVPTIGFIIAAVPAVSMALVQLVVDAALLATLDCLRAPNACGLVKFRRSLGPARVLGIGIGLLAPRFDVDVDVDVDVDTDTDDHASSV